MKRCADQTGALSANAETVAEKILYLDEVLGGISRVTFQMTIAALPPAKLPRSIELLGTRIKPLVQNRLVSTRS